MINELFPSIDINVGQIGSTDLPIPPTIDPNESVETNCAVLGVCLQDLRVSLNFLSPLLQLKAQTPLTIGEQTGNLDNSIEEDKRKRLKYLCKYLQIINILKNLLPKFVEIIEKLTVWAQWLINKTITDAVKWCLKYIQICVLFIKRQVNNIKIFVLKIIRNILIAVKGKKGSWMSAAINAALLGIFEAFKFIAKVAMYILIGVQTLVNAIPAMIAVGAESMVFFITPRSIEKTDIVAANINFSVVDRIPTWMKNTFDTIVNAVKEANKGIAIAMIAAGAAAGAAAVFAKEFKIPKFICKAFKVIDPENIVKQIEKILTVFVAPEGLPKYEKLKITNIGFLAFLITGFCMSGHIAFGFPGCP